MCMCVHKNIFANILLILKCAHKILFFYFIYLMYLNFFT